VSDTPLVSVISLMLTQKGPKPVVDYSSIFDIRHVLYVTTPNNARRNLTCSNYHLTCDTETAITTDEITSNICHRWKARMCPTSSPYIST